MDIELNLDLKKKKKKKPKKKEDRSVENDDYTYLQMLKCLYKQMGHNEKEEKLKIPTPIVVFINKRTQFQNFGKITEILQRKENHIQLFYNIELLAQTSINRKKELIIKGRYSEKEIGSLLKKYISRYVKCWQCKSLKTKFKKDKEINRNYIECNNCGAKKYEQNKLSK